MTELIIDVHSHPLLSDSLTALTSGDATPHISSSMVPPWSVAEHLETMDQYGIGTCILSMTGLADILNGASGRATARRLNEQLATLIADHPGRFGAFAVVPVDDADATNEEMAYALDVLKLDGVSASPHRGGVYLGEPVYDAWFEEMHRRAVTLFVHPAMPPYFDPFESRLNVSVLEFMFETSRMVTGLVLSGRKARFDGVKIIAPHGGGTIPYLANRIALASQMPWAYRDGAGLGVPDVVAGLASFYYDVTASTSAAQLEALRLLVPAERLLMGFDYPMMPSMTISPAIAGLEAYCGFDDEAKAKIRRSNALELFPRFG